MRRRIQKELLRYQEELARQRERVAGMRASGADEFDVKKQVRARARVCILVCTHANTIHAPRLTAPHRVRQVEVQGETEVMVPDTMRRLDAAVDDLRDFVVRRSSGAR